MMIHTRSILVLATMALAVLASGPLQARALVGTTDDGNLGIFLPNPSQGLPNPQLDIVAGLPSGARPHGSAIIDVNRGLIADFANRRVFVVSLNPASLIATIPTPGDLATGTLAVSPDRSVALLSGHEPHVTVLRAPFGPGSAQNTIALPVAVPSFATQNIVFDAAGRAYVRHEFGISVIDPPYQAVAFTVPIASSVAGGIAIAADGSRLLVGSIEFGGDVDGATPGTQRGGEPLAQADLGSWLDQARGSASNGLDVLTLPLSPASTAQRVELFQCRCIAAGLVITPDSQRVLIALGHANPVPGTPLVFSLPAPFTDASALEILPLPDGFPVGLGFEDIGLSLDGGEAMIVGNSNSTSPDSPGGLPALHIRAPFTAAGAQLSALELPGGRGAGSVRYAPAGTVPPPPPPPAPAQPVPVDSPWSLLLLAVLLIWVGATTLRVRRASA